MLSWKTLSAGVLITVVISLSFELVFILAASFIGGPGSTDGLLAEYRQQLWYLSALLTHCLSMAVGGAITVLLFSHHHHIRHAVIVGILASSSSLISLLSLGTLNLMSLLYVMLGGSCAGLAALWITRICAEQPQSDPPLSATSHPAPSQPAPSK